MDGMGGMKPYSRGSRLRVALPWIAFSLCLLYVVNALAFDMFSIVYAQAPGTKTLSSGPVIADISNSEKGYIMVRHSGSNKKLKARVTYGGNEYTYDLRNDGEYETFPLQFGAGKYQLEVFENSKGTSYARVFNKNFSTDMPDPNAPFLSPNQYVWYVPSTSAIAKSYEICDGLETDMQKAKALYDWVGTHIMYDYIKALAPPRGYIPDVDETLNSGMGICFDYAALLGCMLRVQGIPTKLIIGDLVSMNQYHAWNVAYLDGDWRLMDATFYNVNYTADEYVLERFY